MVKRLGDACYWIGLIWGGLWCLVIISGGRVDMRGAVFLGLVVGIPFVGGWLIRYVATGRTDLSPAPTPTD